MMLASRRNVCTSQRVTDVVLKAFEAAAASQGCCECSDLLRSVPLADPLGRSATGNNLTFGTGGKNERGEHVAGFGYYEVRSRQASFTGARRWLTDLSFATDHRRWQWRRTQLGWYFGRACCHDQHVRVVSKRVDSDLERKLTLRTLDRRITDPEVRLSPAVNQVAPFIPRSRRSLSAPQGGVLTSSQLRI